MPPCLKPLRAVSTRKITTLPIEIQKRKMGSGSYNIVFNATVKKGKCTDAGKKVIFRRTKDYLLSKKSFAQEIKMCIKMAEVGAGPEIYKSGVDEKDRGFMIMEHFPNSLRTLMDRKSPPKWKNIEDSLKIPLKKMARAEIFCSDLKFRNVVCHEKNNKLICKLIDFGDDFCTWQDNIVLPKKYLKGVKNPVDMPKVLYAAMLMLFSINSEKHRKKLKAPRPFFADDVKKIPLEIKALALIIISHATSADGTMAKPISQARHYYSGYLKDSQAIFNTIVT